LAPTSSHASSISPGGRDAQLVVIPTANGAESYPPDWSGLKMFKDFGVTNITVLHTNDRKVADSEAFVKPITTARAGLVSRRPAVAARGFVPAHADAA
jgi:cyanophycinase-like exopeptidase